MRISLLSNLQRIYVRRYDYIVGFSRRIYIERVRIIVVVDYANVRRYMDRSSNCQGGYDIERVRK
jgi:hypothetical protein